MNTKRILLSLAAIIFAGSVIASGTGAFFSDQETSTGNVFTAGAIDLKVDSQAHYNGNVCVKNTDAAPNAAAYVWSGEAAYPKAGTECNGTWDLTDLGPTYKFFNYADVKPGDQGENTISLHVENNDAWACVNIVPTKNDDVSSNEPELEAGDVQNTDSIFDGELAQNMQFHLWADTCNEGDAKPGDNVYQSGCDKELTTGTGPIVPTSYPIVTPAKNVFTGGANSPLTPADTRYIGISWNVPSSVGNIIQTDTYQADISFYVEQARNNPNFTCKSVTPAKNTLRLENENVVENGPWTIIPDDVYVDLTWTGDQPTFNYTLSGKALAPNTEYDLVYYADGWPGNHPGKFIGAVTSDGSSLISGSGSPNLNMDLPSLPDGNFAAGAKIWLVPATDYDEVNNMMIAWNPANYLFEGNVYIKYHDTDITP